MKLSKKIISVLSTFTALALFFSCASAGNLDSSSSKTAETSAEKSGKSGTAIKLPPPPERATEAPVYDFTGDKIKIEAEEMYYDGFSLAGDAGASESYALKLRDESSWAIAEVNFPAGTYEGVANVLAPDSAHSRFNISINKDSYLVYGSEPPIGKYELTTRAPLTFTLDKPTTVTVKIQQNDVKNPLNNGQNGMSIDFIVFKKLK